MNKELIEALDALEKEKEISKETLFEAIENSLLTACKNHFGKADNVKVEIDRETGDFLCYAEKTVVETAWRSMIYRSFSKTVRQITSTAKRLPKSMRLTVLRIQCSAS